MNTIAEFKAIWNAEAIMTPAEKMRVTLLKEAGAYTRSTAKNSMIDVNARGDAKRQARLDKKISRAGFILSGGKQVSKPGAAAFSRIGYVKKFIFFDADKDSVVIGPAKLQGVKSEKAVEILEHGGIEQITITSWIKGKKTQVPVTANYKARPTMGLAFRKMIDKKLPKLIEGGIMREV
ncbi:MAG: hypothetical protein EXS16_21820 [Gemmataceae bacterium]|nr:hypothetical protein [Gemmataceae bacterium]